MAVDGRQHYADGDQAGRNLYVRMVAEDRRLRLNGYELYRFGGAELTERGAEAMPSDFDQLTELTGLMSQPSTAGAPVSHVGW